MAKQNKTKLYAEALVQIILDKKADGPERSRRTVANFVKFLDKNGQIGRAKEILELAEDLLLAKQGKRKITFETARATTASQKKILDGVVNKGDVVKEKINPQLIAGIKIIINDAQQFDSSMQSKLNNIL